MSALDEALSLKKALEKADVSDSHSGVKDVLQALEKLSGITQQIIKETKLGSTLKDLKGKYDKENPELGKLITNILRAWTKIVTTKKGKVDGPVVVPAASSAAPKVHAVQPIAPREPLQPQRQKIVDLLSKTLAGDVAKAKESAEAVGFAVEELCWIKYPCDKSGKQTDYSAKIRTLNFNLKKNEVLRAKLLNNSVSATQLLKMSAEELASSHVLEVRAIDAAEDEAARRQDWSENLKKEIFIRTVGVSTGADGTQVEVQDMFDFDDEPQEASDDDGD
jgi:hypothetical protein